VTRSEADTCIFNCSDFVRNAQGLSEVITQSRAFVLSTAKAKTAKLSKLIPVLTCTLLLMLLCVVRTLLDFFNSIPGSQQVQVKTLTDNIQWAKAEKRMFLKHNLEIRLAGL
jgi:26S proteasome regulatory subunit N6